MTKTSFTAADLTATLDEFVTSVVNPATFALSQRFWSATRALRPSSPTTRRRINLALSDPKQHLIPTRG